MPMIQTRIMYDACPLCEGKEIATVATADCSKYPHYHPSLSPTMTWCRCSACGHIFTDGYFTKEAAALVLSKTHQSQVVGFDLEKQRFVSAVMIDRILPYVQSGEWLDVGFGNAVLLLTAEEYGFTPVGIDLRRDSVATLGKVGIEAHCMDVGDFHAPGRFSVISMADVLEHIAFPKRALTSAHALLKEGGVLFLSMPNSDSALWRHLTSQKANPYWSELEHFHNFGRKRLYELLNEHKFEPVRFGVSQRYRACMEVIARKR